MVEMDDGLVYDNKPKEIEIILDEKLNKKVKKVLKKMTYYDEKNRKIIEKVFGSLDFKDEYGNSLAHLFIINTDHNSADVRKAIITLRHFNRISYKNCNGDDFLQYFVKNFKYGPELLYNIYSTFIVYVDVNSVDNHGNTLLHNCVLNSRDFLVIYGLYCQFIEYGYTAPENNNFETFYDILEHKYNVIMCSKDTTSASNENVEQYFEFKEQKKSYKTTEEYMELIKKEYFKKHPYAIFNKFGNSYDKNKKLMEYYDAEIKPLFMVANETRVKELLGTIEVLLRLGENPNEIDDFNRTFINYFIINRRGFYYICEVINLAVKYGYDVNSRGNSNLLTEMINCYPDFDEEFYILLCRLGYKNIEKDYIGAYDDNSDAQKGFKDFRIRCFIKIFNIESSKFNLVSTINNIRDNNFFNMMFELIDSFQNLFGFNNDYEFIKFLIEEIVNERNNNVTLRTDMVNEKEILNTLVSCVNKKTEEKIVKVLKK